MICVSSAVYYLTEVLFRWSASQIFRVLVNKYEAGMSLGDGMSDAGPDLLLATRVNGVARVRAILSLTELYG